MKTTQQSRRDFLRNTTFAAGAAAIAPAYRAGYAAERNTIQIALIGCGGRGTGAVGNAFEANAGPIQVVAMADVFPNRLKICAQTLKTQFGGAAEVPKERQFAGFDAYKRAMDCLGPGDIAVLGTHAAFRAIHLEYAVKKGLNVFMEKSFAADPAGIKKILALGEEAASRNLKVGTGLMCRHSSARQSLIRRIRDGAMGEILLTRAYRMDSGDRMGPLPQGVNELHWQIQHPYFLFWVSSGRFIDYLIHQVDECCWVKDAWPVSAQGFGGRSPDNADAHQNFEAYAVEYTFADGTKALVNGRFMPGCDADFATFVHGTKCAGQFSGNVHAPVTHLYKDQRVERQNIGWRADRETVSPYVEEWKVLIDAIRNDKPHNEVRRSAMANLVAIMGRAAVHSGREIRLEDALKSDFRFCEGLESLGEGSLAPVQANAAGRYPVPVPGEWREV